MRRRVFVLLFDGRFKRRYAGVNRRAARQKATDLKRAGRHPYVVHAFSLPEAVQTAERLRLKRPEAERS